MRWNAPFVHGTFLRRLHRFGALVEVGGREAYCAVTNCGRLQELLFPGNAVALTDHGDALTKAGAPRKTRYSIRLARFAGRWMSLEANLAPRLLEEAWRAERVPELAAYRRLTPEVRLDVRTRFDFRADGAPDGTCCWVEVKCVTFVDEHRVGRFPDAPSTRAVKHLRELAAEAKRPSTRSLVVFVLQNAVGESVGPKDDTDPAFGAALREAAGRGVKLCAYRARVDLTGAVIEGPVPLDLSPVSGELKPLGGT